MEEKKGEGGKGGRVRNTVRKSEVEEEENGKKERRGKIL